MKSPSLLEYSVTVPPVTRPVLHHRLDPKHVPKCVLKQQCPELASALDRTTVSNRNAAFILHVAAKTYGTGQDPSDMLLSVSSIQRSRSQHHMQAAAEAKASSVSDSTLVVHFDGKLLQAIAGGPENDDRIAGIVTDLTCEKLLGIPKVVQGTGKQVAKAAAETLDSSSLTNDIVGMSSDTTAANTGHLNGACVLLEQKSGRKLLQLAC